MYRLKALSLSGVVLLTALLAFAPAAQATKLKPQNLLP